MMWRYDVEDGGAIYSATVDGSSGGGEQHYNIHVGMEST
jgi:hypothetical protein